MQENHNVQVFQKYPSNPIWAISCADNQFIRDEISKMICTFGVVSSDQKSKIGFVLPLCGYIFFHHLWGRFSMYGWRLRCHLNNKLQSDTVENICWGWFMNQEHRAEKLQEITKTAQNLKIFSSLALFFAVLYVILSVVFILSKEITIEGLVNSLMPAVGFLLLSGFLGQQQKGFESIKALLEDKE